MTMGSGGIFGNPFKKPNIGMDRPDWLDGTDVGPANASRSGGGFFGEGGAGRNIAGYIGDALLQMSGMRPMYAPQQQYNRALQDKLRMAQMERQQGRDDYVWQKQVDQQFPKPVNNDTANDYKFISDILGPEAGKNYLRNLGDPMVTVQLPGNRVYSGPRSGLATALGGGQQQGSGPAVGTIEDGYRFKGGNPSDQSNWEPVSIGNTPAPQLGPNGFPATLTPAQYQAVVNEKGRAATDAWMARNNIRVGGR